MRLLPVAVLLICVLNSEVTAGKDEKLQLNKQIKNLRLEFDAFKEKGSTSASSTRWSPTSQVYIQQDEWVMAFRMVSGNQKFGYDAYMDTRRSDDVPLVRLLTPCTCLRLNGTCTVHYRGSVLTLWAQLPIDKVRLSVYEGGRERAYAVFNGEGSSFTSWFSAERLEDSSWIDLKTERTNFFSISGDNMMYRRFFVNNDYPGCENDAGWLVVKDTQDTCPWGQASAESYPLILYSRTGRKAVYQSEGKQDEDV